MDVSLEDAFHRTMELPCTGSQFCGTCVAFAAPSRIMNAHVKLLLLSTSLQACACFQFLPVIQELSLQPRSMTMRCRQKYSSPGEAYFLPLSRLGPTRLGRSTTFRAEPEGNDGARFGGGEEGESDEDYSADALTTFLGKFLPGKGASDQPQAKDLVSPYSY